MFLAYLLGIETFSANHPTSLGEQFLAYLLGFKRGFANQDFAVFQKLLVSL